MSVGGSVQLRMFRRTYRDTGSIETACAATGMLPDGSDTVIGLAEARIHIANDLKNPPPPEAFELIGPSGKETAMAAAAEQEPQNGGEYKRPDAAKAFDIYDKQIKPKKGQLETIRGDLSQPYDDIKEHANFPRKVLDFIVSLEGLEDAKRDHFLLALAGGLEHRKLFLPRDLVTMADGNDGGSVIPIGEGKKKPHLATLPMGVPSDGSETDLGDAGEGDDFEEMTEEELAAQDGRTPAEPEAEAAE